MWKFLRTSVTPKIAALSVAMSLTACSFGERPSAELTQDDYLIIENQFEQNEQAFNSYSESMAECGRDNLTCSGKVSFLFYEKMFESAGFSQIKTLKTYGSWATQASGLNMAEARLSLRWSEALMGVSLCVRDNECSKWLVDENYAKQSDIDEIRKIK